MVAVDVMGGDRAPQVVLEGCLAAARKSVPVALYGPRHSIEQWLDANDPVWRTYRMSIIDAPGVIDMAAEPVAAVRKQPQSSLVQAIISVANGASVAAVSAGNSGAIMAASVFGIGRQSGVERPAIAGFFMTQQAPTLVLDLGANTDCRPSHLYQFAHLGAQHLEQTKRQMRPRIGLLSNGHEPGKGNIVSKEAFHLLCADTSLNFMGNVEPYDLFAGRVDMVVCDGFVGNVLLKTMESVGALIQAKVPGVPDVWSTESGALLLGVKGTVLICHGNADAHAIEKAVLQAWNISDGNDNTTRKDKGALNTHKSAQNYTKTATLV